jgi:hypothetical protein
MNHDPYRSALTNMPTAGQLGGEGPTPFVRFPFYPTAPWYSTNPNVGYQVRYYSTGISSQDADFQPNSESVRIVQFDIPCRLIAINGACSIIDGDTQLPLLNINDMNQTYLFRAEYTTGDKLHTEARLASTVLGIGSEPGEIGGHGYNIDQGASLICGITPLINPADVDQVARIDITFVCLEMRAPRNFSIR